MYECVVGGLRSVRMWAQKPVYSHYPIEGAGEMFHDKGWNYNFNRLCIPAGPMLEQDSELVEKVWQHIVWSCCPKGVSFESHIEWCNTQINPSETNLTSLLNRTEEGKSSNTVCNINHKRFLLEVNLRTNCVRILTPRVDWHYGEKIQNGFASEDTVEIADAYATDEYYELPPNFLKDIF